MPIHSFWASMPEPARRPLGTMITKMNLGTRFLNRMLPRTRTDGFITMTPDTPPAIYRCLQKVGQLGVVGDYCEFGLFRGYSFWYAQQAARLLRNPGMKFFGFDSFQGLPEPRGSDGETDDFHEGDYACSRETVEANLTRYGVDWSRTRLVEGFYDESLRSDLKAELGLKAVALALVDCDLYHSTVSVLEFLGDLLQHHSILMFDDWNCFEKADDKGERLAFREFLDRRPEWSAEPFLEFGWHGQSFLLKKNDRLEV